MSGFFKFVLFAALSTSALALSLSDISNKDASSGLKQALTQGATNAIASLGKDGGFLNNPDVKIPLPGGLAKADGILRMAGVGKQADALVTAMNRAAEAAMPEAKPLMINAVKSMTVEDAKNVLSGGDDSVTQFFKTKTSAQLTQTFLPIVKKYTANVDLAQKYNKLASQGVQMGLVKAKDADIDNYVAGAALDGLYKMIAEEEKKIRANPMQAAGSMAQKVFGAMAQ